MPPKFYKLNFGNCDRSKLGPVGVLDEIIIMDGQYEYDYDVVEESLPPDICNAHRYETEDAKEFIKAWGCRDPDGLFDEEIDSLPFGLDQESIPKGAIITEIKE